MAEVRVALLQLDVSDPEPVPHRIERTLWLVREQAADADLVVLPELWHVGAFAVDLAREHAQPIDGPLVSALAEVAAETRTWVHGGSLAERAPDGQVFNTSVLIDPTGAVAATYRKIHLFGFDGGETVLMSSGADLVVVDTPLGPTGLATCYDLRFPELFRGLVDRGARAVLLPSGWPSPRIGHWTLLAQARAVEDQLFVLACNEAGVHAGVTLGGRSLVVDPQGTILAEAGDDEQVLRAVVTPERADAWRAAFPVLPDRRLGLPVPTRRPASRGGR